MGSAASNTPRGHVRISWCTLMQTKGHQSSGPIPAHDKPWGDRDPRSGSLRNPRFQAFQRPPNASGGQRLEEEVEPAETQTVE